ncbi:outer membrane beta-barrel protein [Geofilum sp. OHC36d9]|uniref:outer membrane beta-barrel protein n=1 Tax=Geofilum sp. OHC36d9 TaxID=3458413 RepID=UPI0040338986
MLRVYLLAILAFWLGSVFAQDSYMSVDKSLLKLDSLRDVVSVEETLEHTRVLFPGGNVEVSHFSDTITRISVGRQRFEVIDDGANTRIRMVHEPREDFKGHWGGFEMGLNNFFYSAPFDNNLPPESVFMDLNGGKSIVVGINVLPYSIGLQKNGNNIGLVTGLGLTINNYRLDSPYLLSKDASGITVGTAADRPVKKNKITTTWLTVPLLLEAQFPASEMQHRAYISGGLYGGFKMGSHTKVVYDDNGGDKKDKSRKDINLNSFKYGATIRLGYRFVNLFATCDLSPMFQKNQGPEIYPWSVGLTLVGF